MYNTINPINIVYRKPQDAQSNGHKNRAYQEESGVDSYKKQEDARTSSQKKPDYTKNSVNIAQVMGDFKNTITAINAPQEVKKEVDEYLNLVEREVQKEEPSRHIILSNLKNASKIADKYITDTLKKPSRVVEGWVDAVFMQNVVLKSDPNQINDKFKINFPQKSLNKNVYSTNTLPIQQKINVQPSQISEVQTPPQKELTREEQLDILFPKSKPDTTEKKANSTNYYSNVTPEINRAFMSAKEHVRNNRVEDAINTYDRALELAQESAMKSVEAAIHYEKGRIYDNTDSVRDALNEYNQATKLSEDNNLKTQAHLRMARIYDDYVKYEPALLNYHKAIAYSGEANNPEGQTVALRDLTGMFTQRFDINNTQTFADLTLDSAEECKSTKTKGRTYSEIGRDYEYIGENKKALECYKNAAKTYEAGEESPYEIAQNYLDASNLMRKLGNNAKAEKLLLRYHQYLEQAQQNPAS